MSEKHIHHNSRYDRIGMILSAFCVLHCLISPFIILLFPFFGEYGDDVFFHIFMFLIVTPIAIYSFYGAGRSHKHWQPLKLGVFAIGFLVIGLGVELMGIFAHSHDEGTHIDIELAAHGPTILGSLILVMAHYLNYQKCRCKNHS